MVNFLKSFTANQLLSWFISALFIIVGITPEQTISKLIKKLFKTDIAMLESIPFQFLTIVIGIIIICYTQRKYFEQKLTDNNKQLKTNSNKPNREYIETYLDFECTPQSLKLADDSNVSKGNVLGSYSTFLNDSKKEVFFEIIVYFTERIIVNDYKIDITKLAGKVENPYLMHAYGNGEEGGICSSVILKVGNIDVNNGKYRIQFLGYNYI